MMKKIKIVFIASVLFGLSTTLFAQQVPFGINYQAVARDGSGSELTSRIIDIKFSIYSGSEIGLLEYQEVHSGITTTKYGVFNVIIGTGTPLAGVAEQFSEISWEDDTHFLTVDIKFASEFVYMGTMQFLSVPYALYAAKSLEPGPEGPQGPPGDPATDDQTLSFDGENLSIAGGNTVNLANLLDVDDADADPSNEIQDLRLENDSIRVTLNPDAVKVSLKRYRQDLAFDAVERKLQISDGNEVDLSSLTNTDNQELYYNPETHELTILNGTNIIDLDELKDDADADPSNELISDVTIEGSELVITEGSNEKRVDLSSNVVAFRAEKNMSTTGLNLLTDYPFNPNNIKYNTGGFIYNSTTGEIIVPYSGIYTLDVGYLANGTGDIRKLLVFVDGDPYETLETGITQGTGLVRSITMRLSAGATILVKVNTGSSTESGSGTISVFKVF